MMSVAAWALGACDDEIRVIETELAITLPEGDEVARAELDVLEVEVWQADDGACATLTGWRTAVCGGPCTPAPRPEGRTPMLTTTLVRERDGRWSSMPMPVTGDAWEVVVRGLDTSGTALLHGCRAVVAARPGAVRLWRPWCDVEVCAGQMHRACPVAVDCRAPALDDPDGLGAPRCVALTATASSWEESGRACPQPDDALPFPPCRSAIVRCAAGVTELEREGVCPRPGQGATMCGESASADLDCDGVLPGPCETCVPGTIQRCGSASGASCAGASTCGPDGRFGDCVLAQPSPERCDGADGDCDELADDVDPDALVACNAGIDARAPRADGCTGDGQCTCGRTFACAEGEACCANVCVSLASVEHCGACHRACRRGEACRGSMCVAPPIDAGPIDAGALDSGPMDAGPTDAGPMDAGPADAGLMDTGVTDASVRDGAALDAGPSDDAGPPDAGPPSRDARVQDRGP